MAPGFRLTVAGLRYCRCRLNGARSASELVTSFAADPSAVPRAAHRGYDHPAALFGPRVPGYDLVERVIPALGRIVRGTCPDLILGPLAIGDHFDHHVARDALQTAAEGFALLG